MQAILKELAEIKLKLATVDSVESKIDKLQKALEAATAENAGLREENEKLKKELEANQSMTEAVRNHAEAVERHQRSWSIRIQGVPLTMAEERDMGLTMAKVYKLALEPILRGAVESGAIRQVPDFDQLLESAHVLPGKQGAAKPIIARFRTRFWKSLCFKHRKDHAVRVQEQSGGARAKKPQGEETRSKYQFPFYDDLTKATYTKMLELQADPRVQSCWSINGYLRFKLKSGPSVKKVNSVHDKIADILK